MLEKPEEIAASLKLLAMTIKGFHAGPGVRPDSDR
jgi:hypothetical protein